MCDIRRHRQTYIPIYIHTYVHTYTRILAGCGNEYWYEWLLVYVSVGECVCQHKQTHTHTHTSEISITQRVRQRQMHSHILTFKRIQALKGHIHTNKHTQTHTVIHLLSTSAVRFLIFSHVYCYVSVCERECMCVQNPLTIAKQSKGKRMRMRNSEM